MFFYNYQLKCKVVNWLTVSKYTLVSMYLKELVVKTDLSTYSPKNANFNPRHERK